MIWVFVTWRMDKIELHTTVFKDKLPTWEEFDEKTKDFNLPDGFEDMYFNGLTSSLKKLMLNSIKLGDNPYTAFTIEKDKWYGLMQGFMER